MKTQPKPKVVKPTKMSDVIPMQGTKSTPIMKMGGKTGSKKC